MAIHDAILLFAGITLVGALVVIPLMFWLMRRGNVKVEIYRRAGKGWIREWKTGVYRLNKETNQPELVIYDKPLGSTTINDIEIEKNPDGTVALYFENGQYLPIRFDVDIERVKAEPLLNPAIQVVLKSRYEKNAQRTIHKKPSFFNQPAVLFGLMGIIFIAGIVIAVGPLSEQAKALQETSQSMTAILQEMKAQNITLVQPEQAQNTGPNSPFANKQPAG